MLVLLIVEVGTKIKFIYNDTQTHAHTHTHTHKYGYKEVVTFTSMSTFTKGNNRKRVLSS